MTTPAENIDSKKSEKAVLGVLDSNSQINPRPNKALPPLNKTEKRVYENLTESLEQIKLHQEGKIELRDVRELLNEL